MTIGRLLAKEAITESEQVASLLAGAWRPPGSKVSNAVLEKLAPLLSKGGAAALAWFCVRQQKSELSESVASFYYNAYVASAARAAVHEAELQCLVQAFNACNVRCILLKGWSIGRLYPESGLRPSGDLDLWVDPEHRKSANEILREVRIVQTIDLEHDQLHRFKERCFGEFYASCETARLGTTLIKVPRREDQLRILCLHFLKHGGWRPIWLCDIAVLLESQKALNWDFCFGTNSKWARWIGSTIALARDVLGARVPEGASPELIASPPKWLLTAVLREWGYPWPPNRAALSGLLPYLWKRPWHVKTALAGRWRNSVQVTVDCNGAFNTSPRWPYQIRNLAIRTKHFLSS